MERSQRKREGLEAIIHDGVSRREFAKKTMLGSLVAVGGLSLMQADELAAQALSDTDILNFALNLEYLEAEFYAVAATGRRIEELGLDVGGRGRRGTTVGGAVVALDEKTRVVAQNITNDELQHVRLLRAVLRSDAVAKPDINLEALGIGFRNQTEFITLARAFEDTGVSAYGGAAPLIDNTNILAAAAQIALTEAQHAGMLRYIAYDKNVQTAAVDEKDLATLGSPNGKLFYVDGNGLSITRTAAQVLSVVYGGPGKTGGAFFPNGVNGAIARS